MYDVRGIIRRNNRTFYDYSTQKKFAIWPRICVQAVIALVLALISADDIKDFLNGILATQSILTGFAFTLLFYLMSADAAEIKYKTSSLEHKERIKRIKKLSKELFDNISYYALVSLTSVVLATILLVAIQKEKLDKSITYLVGFAPARIVLAADAVAPYVNIGVCAISALIVCILYFFIIEGFYNFFRNIDRVNFLFSERIDIASSVDDSAASDA